MYLKMNGTLLLRLIRGEELNISLSVWGRNSKFREPIYPLNKTLTTVCITATTVSCPSDHLFLVDSYVFFFH